LIDPPDNRRLAGHVAQLGDIVDLPVNDDVGLTRRHLLGGGRVVL
jgi:hypothetical protein